MFAYAPQAGDSLNYNSSFNTYTNALIFSLAHPYGTPTVLSSYYFASTSDGAPNGGMSSLQRRHVPTDTQ